MTSQNFAHSLLFMLMMIQLDLMTPPTSVLIPQVLNWVASRGAATVVVVVVCGRFLWIPALKASARSRNTTCSRPPLSLPASQPYLQQKNCYCGWTWGSTLLLKSAVNLERERADWHNQASVFNLQIPYVKIRFGNNQVIFVRKKVPHVTV